MVSLGSIWNPDLSTRMGAESAADMGGLACFFYAALSGIGMAISAGSLGYDSAIGIASLAILAVQAVLAIAAGLRLRAGKGAFLASAVFAIMVLEVTGKLIGLAIGVGLIFNVILLIITLQGVRGAFALRKGDFDDEDAEAFA